MGQKVTYQKVYQHKIGGLNFVKQRIQSFLRISDLTASKIDLTPSTQPIVLRAKSIFRKANCLVFFGNHLNVLFYEIIVAAEMPNRKMNF